MPISSQVKEETLLKVQRLEIEAKFLPIRKYASNISKSALATVELAKREPEIVIYNVPDKPVCLAIQGHPEMMHLDSPIIEKLNQLVYSLIK